MPRVAPEGLAQSAPGPSAGSQQEGEDGLREQARGRRGHGRQASCGPALPHVL